MSEDDAIPRTPGSDGYQDGSDGYQDGSDGYQDGSDGYQERSDGSDGYQDGSDGYQDGSDGYQDQPGDSDRPASEWWVRLGFASFEEYLAGLEANQQRYSVVSGRRPRAPLPRPQLVGEEAGDLYPPVAPEHKRERQVGIRLRAADYSLLVEAAAAYGVAPSTMARMLVRRGAQAVLEAQANGDGDGAA